jgi:hypothetical protein
MPLRRRGLLSAGSPLLAWFSAAAVAGGGGCNLLFELPAASDARGDAPEAGEEAGEVDARDDGDARDQPDRRDDADVGDEAEAQEDEAADEAEAIDDGAEERVPRCGDGFLDPGEECDDGNDSNEDACLDNCDDATCGDGYVWAGEEECEGTGTEECEMPCLTTGTRQCNRCRFTACVLAETCNGVDDDCDTICDDGYACCEGLVEDCTTPCMSEGTRTCEDGCRWSACEAGTEACNGVDDDCDTICDDGEGMECCRGRSEACTTGCGSTGSRTCGLDCSWGGCALPEETCNGIDDDCDDDCDELFACCAGETQPCTTDCGTGGTLLCDADCEWGTACRPPAEACNGADDDCDLATDEDFACRRGAERACFTSCLTWGSQTCDDSCAWGACRPPVEICDAMDQDCDGVCDNGFDCCASTPAACTTACGTPGIQGCSATCAHVGGCCAATETCCNWCDDDCDGGTDEGCACEICTGALNVSAGGRNSGTRAPGASAQRGSCGGDGVEVFLTFTTTTAQDVFITTHKTAYDTVLYVRECCCNGPELACNDDADGLNTSVVNLRDLPPGTYNVFLDAKGAAGGGAWQLDIYFSDPGITGDRCGDPLLITSAGDTDDSCLFTADYHPYGSGDCPYTGTGSGEDVVYYFVLTEPRTVRFQLCSSDMYCPYNCLDSALYIREVCDEDRPQPACNEDACGYVISTYPVHSDTNVVALPAGLYYLFVDGYWDPGVPGWDYHCGGYNLTATGL